MAMQLYSPKYPNIPSPLEGLNKGLQTGLQIGSQARQRQESTSIAKMQANTAKLQQINEKKKIEMEQALAQEAEDRQKFSAEIKSITDMATTASKLGTPTQVQQFWQNVAPAVETFTPEAQGFIQGLAGMDQQQMSQLTKQMSSIKTMLDKGDKNGAAIAVAGLMAEYPKNESLKFMGDTILKQMGLSKKSTTVYGPDGEVVFEQSEGDAGDPTTKTRSDVQKKINVAKEISFVMDNLIADFNPDFFDFWQKKGKDVAFAVEKYGGPLKDLASSSAAEGMEMASYLGTVSNELNLWVNALSGAAVTPHEAERLKSGFPHEGDSARQAFAKMVALQTRMKYAMELYQKTGIQTTTTELDKKFGSIRKAVKSNLKDPKVLWKEMIARQKNGVVDENKQTTDQDLSDMLDRMSNTSFGN